jgi:YD repeat-containing protein
MKMNLKKVCYTALSACILSWGGICTAADITYTYDDLNRLTKADYGDGSYIEYVYDNAGNRTQKICDGAVIPGDTDADTDVDLKDVILDLQISAGEKPAVYIQKESDVSGEGQIGIQEAVFGMQSVSGLRN